MNKGLLSAFLSTLILAAAHGVGAQQPTSTPDDFNSDTSKDDVLILVNVTAKELKFDAVPNPTVEFPGKRHLTNIWVTQRQNLPDKVEPGVVYRNIGIQLRISSRLADIERIVQEALGEVPVSDEPTTSAPVSVVPEPARATVAGAAPKVITQQPRTARRPQRK